MMKTTEGVDAGGWHALPAEEVLLALGAHAEGLDGAEARLRLERHGANRLPPPPRRGAWARFLAQFNNVLIYILLLSGVATLLLGHGVDSAVIFGVVLVNAVVGYIQEGKAEAALDAIGAMLSPQAVALRDGHRQALPAEDLVPGDVVALAPGDRVPADLRLLAARDLRIDEAMLTGESVPADKGIRPVAPDAALGDRACMAYSGTLVVTGSGLGVVAGTARNTELGRISVLLTETATVETPLLRKLSDFGRQLTLVIVVVAAATVALGVLARGYGLNEMFMAAVGLAVAAIPEGLPAVITITLAIGVQRMAARNAIVRRLPAVEALGSVTVICSDKTGTLTRNEMAVQSLLTPAGNYRVGGEGYAPQGAFSLGEAEVEALARPDLAEILACALACNDAEVEYHDGQWCAAGDPTEAALVALAAKGGLDRRHLPTRLDEIPFDSAHRYMATLHHDHRGGTFIYLKGAPEVVLARCAALWSAEGEAPLDPAVWHARVEHLAARGERVLALARRAVAPDTRTLVFADADGGFALLGLAGIMDPPREEAVAAVARCHEAGVEVKMITGDHLATAREIGRRLGIDGGAVSGRELDGLDPEAFARTARDAHVFARVSPEHKLRLVEALQAGGQVVAMTGDGVNDSPAVKRADVGVAMGRGGTEAAKQAAEIVLADDNFATIAAAVEDGRTVYDNIRKTILFMLPTNGGEALVLIAAIALGLTLPVTPVQILWVNMITAVTLGLALAFEPAEGDVMRRPPRDPAAPLLSRFVLWRVGYASVLIVVGTLGVFTWEMSRDAALEEARTAAVNALVMFEAAYLVASRFTVASTLCAAGLRGNAYVPGAILLVLGFQLMFTYLPFMQALFGTAPVGVEAWLRGAASALALYLAVELEKACFRRWAPLVS